MIQTPQTQSLASSSVYHLIKFDLDCQKNTFLQIFIFGFKKHPKPIQICPYFHISYTCYKSRLGWLFKNLRLTSNYACITYGPISYVRPY